MRTQETYKYKELDDEVEEELKLEIDERRKVVLRENLEMAKAKVVLNGHSEQTDCFLGLCSCIRQ